MHDLMVIYTINQDERQLRTGVEERSTINRY